MDKNKFVKENLNKIIPNPKSELEYKSDFQLLVAVILSAQCTDQRVNSVTKQLFKIYDTPQKLANASIIDVEKIIKPCGFYHNKSKNIIACSRQLVEMYNGQVPDDFDKLQALKGVGRKTANVVLAVAFNKPALPVDTHVYRVSKRLGLSKGKDVRKVEDDLMKRFPKEDWVEIHHLILLFGRYYCTARNPKCEGCVFKDMCTYKGGK